MKQPHQLRMIFSLIALAMSAMPDAFLLLGSAIIVLYQLSEQGEPDDWLEFLALTLGPPLCLIVIILIGCSLLKLKTDKFQNPHEEMLHRRISRLCIPLPPLILFGTFLMANHFQLSVLLPDNGYTPYLYISLAAALTAALIPDKNQVNHSESSETNIKE